MRVRRLDAKHDMTFGHGNANIAQDQECVAQRVRTRLYLLQGEWFLDITAGMPWLQSIEGKPININYANARIKQEILNTDGVDSVLDFQSSLDRNKRLLSVTATVVTIYGTTEHIDDVGLKL
jgi:hypothetical protein